MGRTLKRKGRRSPSPSGKRPRRETAGNGTHSGRLEQDRRNRTCTVIPPHHLYDRWQAKRTVEREGPSTSRRTSQRLRQNGPSLKTRAGRCLRSSPTRAEIGCPPYEVLSLVTTDTEIVERRRNIEDAEAYDQDDKRPKNSSPQSWSLPADRSFEGEPSVSPEFGSKSVSIPYTSAGPRGDDQGNRIRNTVDKNSVTGETLRRTERASEELSRGPWLQNHSFYQEISVPNTVKAKDKDNQREYCCPQCSFPCWLCHTPEVPRKLESDDSGEDESDQSEAMSSIAPSRSSSKRKRSDGLTYLGPKEEHFEEFILRPSGIRIRPGVHYLGPEGLPDDGIQCDASISSQVHLKIDQPTAGRISKQFLHYHFRRYDEATFKQLVTKWLAPFDDYVDPDGPEGVVSLRRDNWKPGKEGPPVPPPPGYTYDWDIEPDMTYMVTLNLFEEDLREAVRLPDLYWLLSEPLGVCPYLTFELKCAEKSGKDSDAKCQISVASVLWLYQRKKLKDELHSSDFSDLRHYSIVINSMDFQIWLAEFDGKVYSIQMIGGGSFHRPEGVEHYVEWSNAIHKWGLGPNARSFKQDVEALWRKRNDQVNLIGAVTPPLS